jgi:hypothetical protein
LSPGRGFLQQIGWGRGPAVNQYALFGQERFRVVDYEVFKIVIE